MEPPASPPPSPRSNISSTVGLEDQLKKLSLREFEKFLFFYNTEDQVTVEFDEIASTAFLLEHPHLTEVRDSGGNTYLHLLIISNIASKASIIKSLILNGFDPNAINSDQKTPLSLAIDLYWEKQKEQTETTNLEYNVILTLLENGAKILYGITQLEENLIKIFLDQWNEESYLEDLKENLRKYQLDPRNPNFKIAITNFAIEIDYPGLLRTRAMQILAEQAEHLKNERDKASKMARRLQLLTRV